jgi:CRISPR-associated endonuclease Cas2
MTKYCYLISYDLNKDKDYSELYKAIKAYGTWAHIQDSIWAVVSTSTAEEVFDNLNKHVDKDDSLFVLKSGRAAKWKNQECKSEWLKENL